MYFNLQKEEPCDMRTIATNKTKTETWLKVLMMAADVWPETLATTQALYSVWSPNEEWMGEGRPVLYDGSLPETGWGWGDRVAVLTALNLCVHFCCIISYS